MQNAKDTFYLALRERLAALNPARTITLAGTARPGILVEENEAPVAQLSSDVFVLRWTGAGVDQSLPAMLETQTCEISYWTRGSDTNMDMDRGRLLTAMDAELASILQPTSAQKQVVAGSLDLPMNTNIFWLGPVYGAVKRDGERLLRAATVQVFSLQETLSNGNEEL
jgi:hypothetical protein